MLFLCFIKPGRRFNINVMDLNMEYKCGFNPVNYVRLRCGRNTLERRFGVKDIHQSNRVRQTSF